MEILSSSGYPTVQATVEVEKEVKATASVPIGSSRGKYEAHYLFDGGSRFGGRGMKSAVANINGRIAETLKGHDVFKQSEIDEKMIKLDGSKNKSTLGANAILAVSLAIARAGAEASGVPLFQYLGGGPSSRIPVPSATVLAGGKYSPSKLDFEDYLYVLHGFDCFMDSMEALVSCFYRLKELIYRKSGPAPSVGGGALAPPLKTNEEALDLMMEAVSFFGLEGKVGIGIDIVGGELCSDSISHFKINNRSLSRENYIDYLENLASSYPIIFLEDPFGEDDFESFSILNKRIGKNVKIVGDDLFVTNIERLKLGIGKSAGNSLLLKMNQVGTLTEAIGAGRMARDNHFEVIVSVRSSDTNDAFASDLAVALPAGLIKIGAPVSGEKAAKYNRLLEIESEMRTF